MKKILYILCAVFLLAACDKDVHDEPKSGNGFLSIALIWEDKLNSTDEIESVNLWIYDNTGALSVDEKYTSANELALEKYELAAGNVVVVIGVNVNEPIEAQQSFTPEDLKYELARQCVFYELSFYGDKPAEVVNGESRAVYVPLHDRPQDSSIVNSEGDINDWQEGKSENGEVRDPVVLNSSAAGTIAANPALLDDYLKDETLTITGKLNEADLQTLGNWAIDNSWDTDESNNLVILDLSGTDITAIPYLFMYNNQTKNYSAQYVQKVILPETVTTIDTHAFNCCTALNSINTGNVESMGNFVFGRCPDISNLDLSALKSIKQSAFRECVNLKSVNMPVVADLGGRTFNEAYITELRIGAEKFSGVSSDVFEGFDRKGECTLYLSANQIVTNEGKWTPTGGTDKIETVDVSGFKAVYCGDIQVWPL